jgi:hypothetical protein
MSVHWGETVVQGKLREGRIGAEADIGVAASQSPGNLPSNQFPDVKCCKVTL